MSVRSLVLGSQAHFKGPKAFLICQATMTSTTECKTHTVNFLTVAEIGSPPSKLSPQLAMGHLHTAPQRI